MRTTARRAYFAIWVSLAFFLSPLEAGAIVPNEGPVSPAQWPASEGLQPRIDGWDNSVRIWGADRYQTSLAAALALRGSGDFPFDTPDPTSAQADSLSDAHDWWGVGRCPKTLLIVAGDSPADSLVAASLSDPTGRSHEPYLRRSAAADPLFDPVGGFRKVDTDYAPVLVTSSARSGAQNLAISMKFAVQDLRNGGCSQARQAVIVGGVSAVAPQVETELLALGIDEVFRVAGDDRFGTAAAVAAALGTEALPPTQQECVDKSVIDGDARMGFYVNATIEMRSSATTCQILSKTVVLADGLAGADALAAGWWTSFWQVPVLLHDGSDNLPAATAAALQTLDVDNLVVLGGTSRISPSVATKAQELADADLHRIAGSDRYETSVEMAKKLGGWWPTGRADEFTASMVCLAASSGSGKRARGWPDALGAGAWCAAASGAAANPGTPQRALAPLTGGQPGMASIPLRPGHDAVPVLLVPANSPDIPRKTKEFLSSVFEPADSWCSSVVSPPGCAAPGFAVVFGGPTAVPDSIVSSISALVSGGRSVDRQPGTPQLISPFLTSLSMGPVYREKGEGPVQICLERGSYSGARWLAAGVQNSPAVTAYVDVMMDSWYVRDADGTSRQGALGAQGTPGCLKFGIGSLKTGWIRSVGPSGRSSNTSKFVVSFADRYSVTGPVSSQGPTSYAGSDSAVTRSVDAESILVFLSTEPQIGLVSSGLVNVVESAGLTLTMYQMADEGLNTPDRFEATWNLSTQIGTVYGNARGEAVFVDGSWQLRGTAQVLGGSAPGAIGVGGFSATLQINDPGLADDVISWRFDATTAPN